MAHMLLADRVGDRVSLEEFGRRVAEVEGKAEPYRASTVSRWESGDSAPGLDTLAAIGQLCDVDPGWLAFGGDSSADVPEKQVTLRMVAQARGGRRPRPQQERARA